MSFDFIDHYPTEDNQGIRLEFVDGNSIVFYSFLAQSLEEDSKDTSNQLRFKFVKELRKANFPIRREFDGFLQFGDGQLEAHIAGASEKTDFAPEDMMMLVNQDFKWNYQEQKYENLKDIDENWKTLDCEALNSEIDEFMQSFISVPEETVREIIVACHRLNLNEHIAELHEEIKDNRDELMLEKQMLLNMHKQRQIVEEKLLKKL